MKLKLRIIIGGLAVGGTERHLSYILPALVKRSYDVTVITLSTKDTLANFLRQNNITVKLPQGSFFQKWPFGLRQICQIIVSLLRIARDLRRDPQAITHFFLPEAYILGGLTALLIRHHGPMMMSRRSLNHYQQKYPFISYIEKYLHKRMNFVLANSRDALRELQYDENVPIAHLGLLYNGIDILPTPSTTAQQQLRHTLGLKPDTLIFIIVANLIAYKGHSDLIQALALIQDHMPSDWQLLVVGHDSQRIQQQLQVEAIQSGIDQHIKWLGSRHDTPELLAIAEIGIVASHEEGLSNSLLEAMAASLAMVVTDVGGNPEVVQNQYSGLIVPPHNPPAMAEAILKLATDQKLRHYLAANAQQRIAEHFTLKACVDRYDRVYQVIARHDLPDRDDQLKIKR